MSSQKFTEYKDIIDEGDTIILKAGSLQLFALTLKAGEVFQTKRGAFRHNQAIGQRYGSKIMCTVGWIYVLHPTPELWTLTLPHRTQILYQTDISMVLVQLEIKPGSVVFEAGTGSGSMSHCIIRSIAPTGHLYTFDFHENRSIQAKEDFVNHGISELVTATHRDVCKEGFDIENKADAVFLDLPAPWNVLPFAKKSLKIEGGRICSFSPCIEQVQKTCLELSRLGFTEIRTMECLLRDFHIDSVKLKMMDSYEEEDLGSDEPTIGRISSNSSVKNMTTDDNDIDNGLSMECDSNSNNKKPSYRPLDTETKKFFEFKTALPKGNSQGHTGFLTFASLYKLVLMSSKDLKSHLELSPSNKSFV